MEKSNIRPIAIYLPQFHPIPENDAWWGRGFTEWRNVVKAKPRFKGHYQPHLPADLGYYDLRLPEVRQAQADLARQYGIYGFCYYHYWFNGKRLLERPFEEVFRSGEPNFPFMLCWANENWTRVWDGGEKHVLVEQKYSEADDILHIQSLIPYFKDDRYIKVAGKPVFVIYKDTLFPDISSTLRTFRRETEKAGLELYLCRFDRDDGAQSIPPEALGFDAAIEFQPFSKALAHYKRLKSPEPKPGTKKYFVPRNYYNYAQEHFLKHIHLFSKENIIDMQEFVAFDATFQRPDYKLFPGVSPSWDNTARRAPGTATIFKNSSPALFQQWIRQKVNNFPDYEQDENFLFINAWNEWAEGNHLEPDEKYRHGYLEALRRGLEGG
jgi:lipopolysaccharide biosynthesis protein